MGIMDTDIRRIESKQPQKRRSYYVRNEQVVAIKDLEEWLASHTELQGSLQVSRHLSEKIEVEIKARQKLRDKRFITHKFVLPRALVTKMDESDKECLEKGYVPNWDALTSALFLVGMILMAKKKIEHWLYWIVGDLISIPLYAYKGLYLTSIQFLVFLGIAIAGYVEWRRKVEC